ncbi:MAG: hypothetical protein WCK67_09420 [bacterium]
MSFSVNSYNNSFAMPLKKNVTAANSVHKVCKTAFKANDKSIDTAEYENPINKVGEYALALSKSFYLALGTSARFCFEIFGRSPSRHFSSSGDDDDAGSQLALMLTVGMVVTAVTFALVLPKALYQANIDFFTKKKDMDVYSRDNSFRKNVYENFDERSKKASPEEIKKLSEQSLKLKMANNKLPAFLQNTKNFAVRSFLKGFYMMKD